MILTNVENKPLNRRLAFRINEQVHLFYHKIDQDRVDDLQGDIDQVMDEMAQEQLKNDSASDDKNSLEQSLPDSQSRENDTLNANISSSGMSFTCRESLKPGDYLMTRVFLLSSSTLFMTFCKVVYCKPSNPYEKNRYPYTIGAQFLNLTEQDSELLNQHVHKKRTRKFIVSGLWMCLLLWLLYAPDTAFDLLLDTGNFILDNTLEVLGIGLELVEFGIDHTVESLLHTGRHLTHVISFYILLLLEIMVGFLFLRFLCSYSKRKFFNLCGFVYRKKSSIQYLWGQQCLFSKFSIVSIMAFLIVCYWMFLI